MPLAHMRAWLTGLEPLVPQLTPSAFAALIMLAASLLIFRTFRERYLLVWIFGWVVYLAARTAASGGMAVLPLRYSQAVGETGFVLAVSIFAAAILISVNGRAAALGVFFFGFLGGRALAVRVRPGAGDGVLRA